ncbi:Transcriptional regulator, GntR family [Olavius algarvensis Delta 1 endosymbiont]|nr:Transcriptional regulator, GntR family [Olavius algarvensis Delta 1 endosymbiont]
MQVKPIKKMSTASKVFESLYEMIVGGQFKRGQKLPSQEELARQFGVSRNTLREAMNKLYAMGLLSSHQGIGTVVETPNPQGYLSALSGQFLLDPLSVREFVEARICIERTAVRLAVARAGKHDVERLQGILASQQLAFENKDAAEFARQDAAFHMDLTQLSGNRVLMKFLQTIQDMLHRFIGEVVQLPGAVSDAIHFHRRVTEAIAAQDADRAEREIVAHLFDVVQRIESNLKIDLDLKTMGGADIIQPSPGIKDGK